MRGNVRVGSATFARDGPNESWIDGEGQTLDYSLEETAVGVSNRFQVCRSSLSLIMRCGKVVRESASREIGSNFLRELSSPNSGDEWAYTSKVNTIVSSTAVPGLDLHEAGKLGMNCVLFLPSLV